MQVLSWQRLVEGENVYNFAFAFGSS